MTKKQKRLDDAAHAAYAAHAAKPSDDNYAVRLATTLAATGARDARDALAAKRKAARMPRKK